MLLYGIKQQQQRGGHLLEQSGRIVEGFVDDGGKKNELHGRLGGAWDNHSFNEFHDILSGTSVPAAWDSVRAMQGRARIIGEEVAVETTRRWARRDRPPVNEQQIVVLNLDDATWEGFLETKPFLSFDAWRNRWLSDLEGRPVDFQAVQPDAATHVERVVFPLSFAGGQCAQVLVRTYERLSSEAPDTDLEVSPCLIANAHLRAGLDGSGIRRLAAVERALADWGMGPVLENGDADAVRPLFGKPDPGPVREK
jgi:alpha-mannosidase